MEVKEKEEENELWERIKGNAKKYVGWYIYPAVYFLTISLFVVVRLQSSTYSSVAFQIVFRILALIPTLLWAGAVTLWIFCLIFYTLLSYYLEKRYPAVSSGHANRKLSKLAGHSEGVTGEQGLSKNKKSSGSTWNKVVNAFIYFLGSLLIFAGATLFIWMARPYFTLLLFSSKIEALEKKVETGQVQGNRIIIPSVLIDAPILDGITDRNLSKGVCRFSDSPAPGNNGNFIIEGHNLAEFGLFSPQNFFSLLELAGEGAPIYVFYQGRKYSYKVKKKVYRNVGDLELYDMTPGERLTLITCVSTWSPTVYTNRRTVVIAYPGF